MLYVVRRRNIRFKDAIPGVWYRAGWSTCITPVDGRIIESPRAWPGILYKSVYSEFCDGLLSIRKQEYGNGESHPSMFVQLLEPAISSCPFSDSKHVLPVTSAYGYLTHALVNGETACSYRFASLLVLAKGEITCRKCARVLERRGLGVTLTSERY